MDPRLPRAAGSIPPTGGPALPERHVWSPGRSRPPQLPPPRPHPAPHTYHMPESAGTYHSHSDTTPQSSLSGQSADGSAGSADSSRLLRPRHRPSDPLQTDCQKLERSHRRMQGVFYVLVTGCVLVMVVYLALIGLLLAGGEEDREHRDCVPESDITDFLNIWPAEDRAQLIQTLARSGSVSVSRDGEFCFRSLQWVPSIMGKINLRVQESVSYIEEQQNQLQKRVSAYTAANHTDSKCNTTGRQPLTERSTAADAVYAHYFLQTEAHYNKAVSEAVVRWMPEMPKMSSHNRVTVSPSAGKFFIHYSGFYFIYAHLAFKGGVSDMVHRVVRTRSEERTNLLEAVRGRVSYLQGVFRLISNDVLTVEASVTKLDMSRHSVSYFGFYLIRT